MKWYEELCKASLRVQLACARAMSAWQLVGLSQYAVLSIGQSIHLIRLLLHASCARQYGERKGALLSVSSTATQCEACSSM